MKTLAKLFGSSGVRGLVNENLTPSLVTQIGSAIGTYSRARLALVARDTRTSGPILENALISGLLSSGTNIHTLGMLPTPTLAFLTRRTNADVGIMITASHNPPQYNGIKIFTRQTTAYDEQDQNEIERIVNHDRLKPVKWQNIGKSQPMDREQFYVDTIAQSVHLRKPWRVIVDPGCGATYRSAPATLSALGCKLTTVNAQPDGFFPARSPEPNKESLEPLAKTVESLGADLGIAYDGDGDRVAFIDENGEMADFDRVLAAYAAHVTKKNRGGVIVTNVEASMSVEKLVEANHGQVVRTRVGDVYVTEVMKERNSIFGGEPCGAWIHPKFHYCPDGILSSALIMQTLDERGKKLSEFVSETPKYPMLRKNITFGTETKHKIIEKASQNLQTFFDKSNRISRVDGIRISMEDGWILIRESGTEPLVRLTVEGESLRTARNIMKKGVELVEESARKVE
jgi:phosphoglucosamine mutase